VLPEYLERERLSTLCDASFLAWRYLSIPHRTYEMAALRQSDAPTGAIYRVRPWKGIRLLVMSEIWGPPAARRTLLGAIARRERSSVVRVDASDRRRLMLRLSASPTVVTYKVLRQHAFPPPSLSIGDVEDVL
jgi:hypothetical protein